MRKRGRRCLYLLLAVVPFCFARVTGSGGLAQGILTASGAVIVVMASGLYLYLLGGRKSRKNREGKRVMAGRAQSEW